jgi:flagellar biosynthesis protein
VVAKGRGEVAAQIIERAVAAGVPRIESQALADALVRVDLETAIPPELYLVVAEILAWVYRVDAGYRRGA